MILLCGGYCCVFFERLEIALTAFAQTMGRHCEAVVQTMGRRCEAVAQTMGRHYKAVAQTMGRHCEAVKFTTFCYSERDGSRRPQNLCHCSLQPNVANLAQ